MNRPSTLSPWLLWGNWVVERKVTCHTAGVEVVEVVEKIAGLHNHSSGFRTKPR